MRKKRINLMKKTSLLTSVFMLMYLSLSSIESYAWIFKSTPITIDVTDFGADPSGKKDSTVAIQEAIESAKEYKKEVIINFPKGEYQIYKDKAEKREYHTSNTNSIENPIKTIGILIEEQENLTLEGNGSLFNMHGNMMAIAVVKSENVKLNNFSWDFEVPTTSEMTAINIGNENGRNYVDYYIPSNFRYQIVDNNTNILWTSEESPYTGEYYWSQKGHHNAYAVVVYDPEIEVTRRYNVNEGPLSGVNNIEQLEENKIRVFYNNNIPVSQKIGVVSELNGSSVRETAGAFIWESKDTVVQNVNVHYMHGFGFLTQMSENVTFDTVNFMPREGTGKYTTSFADLIHVSGAAGKITIKNSNFSHAHDDPINIHGTFTRVEEKINDYTLKLKYIHGQQGGFPQYYKGNEVTFFTRDTLMSPNNGEKMYTVKEVIQPGENGNDLRTMIVTFNEKLPEDIDSKIDAQPKYVAENVTYTPELEIVNNIFHTIPTRGILATTRKPVLIEGNEFRNMSMATIYLSNDSDNWYESGPIRDMTIRNNKFYIRESGQKEWRFKSAIYIHPVTLGGRLPSSETPIHKNITIEGNEFYMEHDAVVNAESVENLVIKNNKIFRDKPNVELKLSLENSALKINEKVSLNLESKGTQISGNEENLFYFNSCKDVVLEGNVYDDGLIKNAVVSNMPLDNITNKDSITLNGSQSPTAPVSNVKYVSLNPEVATVSNSGEVTAVSKGTAEILAYYLWNGTSIESNKITITVTDENLSNAESIKISNNDNLVIEDLTQKVQFRSTILPEGYNGQITWSVTEVDGSSTKKAEIDQNGLFTAKENGVVIVKATSGAVEDSKTVVISSNLSKFTPDYLSFVGKNESKLSLSDEAMTITMERGDLYQESNDIKNLVLIDIPKEISKNDMRFTVKVDGLPVSEANRWDTASILLFKDTNNYVSIGRKSHFGGIVSVREENGSAAETSSGNVQATTLIFDIHNKDGVATINYKTPDGDYVNWGTIDSRFLGENYKIGFATWNYDGREKNVTFSDIKIADGSLFTKDTIANVLNTAIQKSNNKPVASDVTLGENNINVGDTVNVNYTYSDEDNNTESASIYRWTTKSEGKEIVEYTTSKSYTSKYVGDISCTVYPIDQYGRVGVPVASDTIKVLDNKTTGHLSSIKFNSIELENFMPENFEYDYLMTNSANSFILSGQAVNSDDNIKISLDDVEIYNGKGSFNKNIDIEKDCIITIEVVSTVNSDKNTYIINVNKLLDNFAALKSMSISELNVNVTESINNYYHYNVNSDIKDITLQLEADNRVGSIKVYEGEYRHEVSNELNVNNSFTANINLTSGSNLIIIEVTAKDGVTKSKHIVNITRVASQDATLSDIKINDNTIEGFASDVLNYNLKLDSIENNEIQIEGIANNKYSNVSITVNNKRVDEQLTTVQLKAGLNEVIITCKAEDSWTTNHYTISVLVPSASNAELLHLESPNNNLNSIFEPRKTEYYINTSNQDFQLIATAQEENASIEVKLNNKVIKGSNKIEVNEKLIPGENVVLVKVTSPDKTEEKTYTINILANEFVYLSDLNWSTESYVGYGDFNRDAAPNGGKITLLTDNGVTTFDKGIGAHAQSELIFNIKGKGYERLLTFAGIDYSQATSQYGSVTFKVLLDGVEAFNSTEISPRSQCEKIDLDLTGVSEVRLIALSGEHDWNDHAVWADAKFITIFEEIEESGSNGDYNNDGVIDIKDLGIASKYYGQNKKEYDINNDNIINEYEFNYIMNKILE